MNPHPQNLYVFLEKWYLKVELLIFLLFNRLKVKFKRE